MFVRISLGWSHISIVNLCAHAYVCIIDFRVWPLLSTTIISTVTVLSTARNAIKVHNFLYKGSWPAKKIQNCPHKRLFLHPYSPVLHQSFGLPVQPKFYIVGGASHLAACGWGYLAGGLWVGLVWNGTARGGATGWARDYGPLVPYTFWAHGQ